MYTPAKERYNIMEYNRCGRSGLLLPKISLGLWHNFGDASDYENMRQLCFTAFDNLMVPGTNMVYRCIHWNNIMCSVCKGSVCTSSRNGSECVFLLIPLY